MPDPAALHARLLFAATLGSQGRSCVDADEAVPIAAALRAVVELHAPAERGGILFCEGDDEGTARGCYDEEPPSWPCSTINAVASALGVETAE